jgi:hypothetical protein
VGEVKVDIELENFVDRVKQVVLEVLDLLVDCPGQRLIPNPASPVYPSLKLK